MKQLVVIGLSGGVDSSVAAYLLKEKGYDVIALFMKNWHDNSVTISNECPWVEDSNDAMLVAEKLGIPFQIVDLSKVYKERIVDYMFNEYARGRTPNPDVLCNREIKFDVFLDIALNLGADYVATGHYCQKKSFKNRQGAEVHQLLTGKDKNKDQSYFLCQLNQVQLGKVLFPIGHLEKAEVRAIALKEKLVTAEKKDSQGLCFIGKVSLPDFLQQQLKTKTGQIIKIPKSFNAYENQNGNDKTLNKKAEKYNYDISDGRLIGEHQGAHFYTIGQRKGLSIGGFEEPLFVIDTDVEENVIYVGEGKSHPGLFRDTLKVEQEEVHWIRSDLTPEIGNNIEVKARIRYRQPLQKATLFQTQEGLYITFKSSQSAITSGQFVAWYDGEELLGSGVIT